MRRISVNHAKLHMVLSNAVFDGKGALILHPGASLSNRDITTLAGRGITSIVVEDPRMGDVVVEPTFSPGVETAAFQAIRQLLMENPRSGPLEPLLMTEVINAVTAMANELPKRVMGEVNVEGCRTLEDLPYLQPTRTAALAMVIGRALDYNHNAIRDLGVAALVKDIGVIWLKARPTDEEFMNHPRLGHDALLRVSGVSKSTAVAVLQHHERWNGSGYPTGLKKDAATQPARIIALADSYCEMVSVRPDARPMMPHEAVEFIIAYSGELFDPKLAAVFTRKVPLYPAGVTVTLSTGQQGMVSDAKLGHIGRPVVRVCTDTNAQPINKPFDIDLSEPEHQSVLITSVQEY